MRSHLTDFVIVLGTASLIQIMSFLLVIRHDASWFVSVETVAWYLLPVAILTFFLFFASPTKQKLRPHRSKPDNKFLSTLSFISLIGFLVGFYNFYYALKNLDSIFDAGRQYELLFGRSTILNYLYFTTFLYVIVGIPNLNSLTKFNKIVLFLSVVGLFFHSTKSTIILPFVGATLYHVFILRRKLPLLSIMLLGSILFLAFFTSDQIRDSSVNSTDRIFKYLGTPIANFDEIVSNNRTYNGPNLTIAPIRALIVGRGNGSTSVVKGTDTTVPLRNEAYNASTIYRDIVFDYGYLGLIIFSLLLFLISRVFDALQFRRVGWGVPYTLFLLALFAVIWGNHFFRYQYIYFTLLVLTIWSVRNVKKNKN